MITRLLRDVKFHKGWFLALIILVALACGIYVSFRSCYDSAYASFNRAYEELTTPDIIVVTKPIEDLSEEIEKIQGVSIVSPAFVTDCYTFTEGKNVRGEISGFEIGERVNNYYIIKGEDFRKIDDVVVELHYAENHNVKLGQEITLHTQGKTTKLKVCGVCFSPKYIYIFSREGVMEKDYGVFFVSREFFGNNVNTFYIKVLKKVNIDDVISRIKSFLEKKGIGGVVQRRDKLFSYTAVMEDVKSLNLLSILFTTVLLATSAVILFVVLFRLVERKRREIGTLRAMGFSKLSIFQYFLAFSGLTFIGGIILSIPLSFGILHFILGSYSAALKIPSRFLTYDLNFYYLGYCSVFTLIFFLLGSFLPSYQAASLAPTEALKSYLGAKKGARIMISSSMSPMKKLIVREIFSHKTRSIGTVLVIALVLSFGLSFALSMGSFEEAIKERFDKNELWDVRVSFNALQNSSVLNQLNQIPEIESVEPYMMSTAEISYKNRTIFIQLYTLQENTKMHAFSFSEGSRISGEVVISGDVSSRLGVSVGAEIEMSTPYGVTERRVSGIVQELGSSEGYLLENLTTFNGALIQLKNSEGQIAKSLQNLSFVNSWVTRMELRQSWLYFLNLFLSFVYAMDIVTLALAFLTVSVFTFLSAKEGEWRFTMLKAMGYANRDILKNGIIQILILSVAGTLIGVPVSMQLTSLFNKQFETVMSGPSVIFIPHLIITRSLLIIGVSLLSMFIVTNSALKRGAAEQLRRVFETM